MITILNLKSFSVDFALATSINNSDDQPKNRNSKALTNVRLKN